VVQKNISVFVYTVYITAYRLLLLQKCQTR